MEEKIFLERKINESDFNSLCKENVPPFIARLMASRGIKTKDEMVPSVSKIPMPDFLPDIDKISDLLSSAIMSRQHIRIMGDYDADGVCSTVLCYNALKQMGAIVSWDIPSRVRHGYGLHVDMVDQAKKEQVDLIITVDNGISAIPAIEHAKKLGMTVCVTDHHLPSGDLPDADCIVNPKLEDDNIGTNLSGTGIAFYVMGALNRKLGLDIKMSQFLDLVAIATVADCMPMDSLNRSLVGAGLARLKRGASQGLSSIMCRLKDPISCQSIGFFIAPQINATGRFDKTAIAVNCLLADNVTEAIDFADQLYDINEKRKKIISEMIEQAESKIDESSTSIVIGDKLWNPGLCGILAGRLAQKYNRPALVFGKIENEWRGSGRAPAEWNLHEIIINVHEKCGKEIMPKFGGHHRAIGASVNDLKAFRKYFEKECINHEIDESALLQPIDKLPKMSEITNEAVLSMNDLVWGEGVPSPKFGGNFNISNVIPISDGKHLRMQISKGDFSVSAVLFNHSKIKDKENIVFSLGYNSYSKNVTAIIDKVIEEKQNEKKKENFDDLSR